MSLKFGPNISSLKAQRQLSNTSAELSSTFERLSSGLRINKASDDAAGLAVANNLLSDKRVFAQGVRNFNEGISLLNLADSALQELTSITTKLAELAEQAASSTYKGSQRLAIETEAQALSEEYTRIARSTTYNGKNIFNADFGQLSLQGGYGISGSIVSGLGGAIGTGAFSGPITSTLSNASALTTADFNGDGIADIAATSATDGTLNIQIANGDGTFRSAGTYALTAGGTGIDTADFNGDGVLDIVASHAGEVGVFLGNGDGTFQTVISTTSTLGTAYDIKAGDFDQDGYADIAIVDSNTRVSVMLGNANGTFGAETTYLTGADPESISIADFNNDGLLDIVTNETNDGGINIFLGIGDGTFGARASYQSGLSQMEDIYAGDFNNDGNLDILSNPKSGSSSISVVFGLGDGTFGSAVSTNTGAGVASSSLGDYNGDGKLDISFSSITQDKLFVMLGNGNGTFTTAVSYASPVDPNNIVSGDFNNDGVYDIVTAGVNSDQLSSYNGVTAEGVGPLLKFSLISRTDALKALSIFENKLDQLTIQSGKIGAFQSRLEVGVNNLDSAVGLLEVAASRIRDIDTAEESSKLVRLKILQNAAVAVLAQANQQPSVALSLLEKE